MAEVLLSLTAIYLDVDDTIKSLIIYLIIEAQISLLENELVIEVHDPMIDYNTTLIELINSSKLGSIAHGVKV